MARVKRVIDGRTFETFSGQWVCLYGVETGGRAEKKRLTEKIGDNEVSVDPVGVLFGRIIALVKIGEESLNDYMSKQPA